jgi:hypothetical protein
MQKDVHFYVTYALARKIGISVKDAEQIAWADHYTDDLTEADLHGIQTQSAIVGNWKDRQIQLSVLVPFHFIPGSDSEHPWMTTRNSPRAQQLVELAMSDVLRLGIALHGLQDTFSHEKFSGWQEQLNACYQWYYIESLIPNVGHAEMRATPDIVNCVWTDPRDGSRVDNKERTIKAARATYDTLVKFFSPKAAVTSWTEVQEELKRIVKIEVYDERKHQLRELSGNKRIRYKNVNKRLGQTHKSDFIRAAGNHLAAAMKSFEDIPRVV